MLEVAPAVPSCQVVQHERGTRKEGLADVGCVCQPGDHVCQLGCCRSHSVRVTNFAGEVVDGTGEGSVGRAAEMMSTAHPHYGAVGSPKGLAGENVLECGDLVEAPIGRTPLPRHERGQGGCALTHITLILAVAVLP